MDHMSKKNEILRHKPKDNYEMKEVSSLTTQSSIDLS